MQKLIKSIILSLIMLIMCPSLPVLATDEVRISVLAEPISLNGLSIENTSRQYPIIVYKGMIYFPLTYDDCRFLGIETHWNQNTGLKLKSVDRQQPYFEAKRINKNSANDKAVIMTAPITINAKNLDLTDTDYPFISFRNIVYVPLKLKYCLN